MSKHSLLVLLAASMAVLTLSANALSDERSDALARGAKLFADPALGANGKSCATCHAEGKAWAGSPRFPKLKDGAPRTLDQMIQICISVPLAAKPLAWDDERLALLALFVDAAYAPKK